MGLKISLAQYLSYSLANGPGKRCVLWFQGCNQKCEYCCNPSFQKIIPPNIDINNIITQIIQDFQNLNLRGITLSGGEPLLDTNKKCIEFLSNAIRQNTNMDIMVFTGYEQPPAWSYQYIDLAIAGPYIDKLKHNKGLIASSNQKILRFNNKFNDISDHDIIYSERIVETFFQNGEIILSGLIDLKERFFNE